MNNLVIEEPELLTIRCKDGREINITDHQETYFVLAAEGKIVFNSRELELLGQIGASQDQYRIFLDIKQTFPGANIQRIV